MRSDDAAGGAGEEDDEDRPRRRRRAVAPETTDEMGNIMATLRLNRTSRAQFGLMPAIDRPEQG